MNVDFYIIVDIKRKNKNEEETQMCQGGLGKQSQVIKVNTGIEVR